MKNTFRSKLCTLCLALLVSAPGFAAGDVAAASRYYEDGLGRFQKGDVGGAILQLKNALQQDNKMLAVHLLLGRALLADGQLPAAEIALREALKLGVSPSEVAIPLGRLYLMGGRPRDVLDKVPVDGLPQGVAAEVQLMRAMAQGQLAQYRESAKSFEAARRLAPASAAPLVAEVPVLLGQGRIAEAAERADAAVALDGQSADAWNMRASVSHATGKVADALEGYGKALELQPSHVDARVARAALLLDLKRPADALRDLDYVREHARGEPRAGYLRAVIAEQRGDRKAAAAALAEVVELVDSTAREWVVGREQMLMLGALGHYELGNRVRAKEYLNILVSRYGRNLGARKLMARVYLDEKDPVRALSMVEPVLKATPRDAQALYLAGEANMALRRYASASDQLEEAARQGGTATRALTALGYAQLGGGQSEQGLATLEASLAQRPGDPSVGFTLATLYLRNGERVKARKVAEQLLAANPRNPVILNFLGVIRGGVGDRPGARQAYRQALEIQPRFKPSLLNLARLDVADGDFDAARKPLEGILQYSRNDVDVLYELGVLEKRRRRDDEARKWLEKARAARPRDPRAGLELVDLHMQNGREAQALELAKNLSAAMRDDIRVAETLGRVQLAMGDAKEARQSFVDMSRLASSDAEALVRAGNHLLAARAFEDAEYAGAKALVLQGANQPAQLLIGLARLGRGAVPEAEAIARQMRGDGAERYQLSAAVAAAAGRSGEAERLYREAFARAPSSSNLIALARVQMATGQAAAALARIETWLKTHPDDFAVLRTAGEAAVRARRLALARGYFERLVKADDYDAEAHNNLGMVLISLGDTAAAQAHARRAYALAPGAAGVLDTLGWSLVKDGKHDEGLRFLRDARLKAPSDPAVRVHIIAALLAAGRGDEARSELAEARGAGVRVDDVEEAAAIIASVES
ncbi:MAG: PEP-CTERM system TPR-repeat protein PrsT [Rhodocyclaceae bacterium]|nr:PEP-CTERM system TPR-repeat protein PrsT [Rhodocyclaceae bacterium]